MRIKLIKPIEVIQSGVVRKYEAGEVVTDLPSSDIISFIRNGYAQPVKGKDVQQAVMNTLEGVEFATVDSEPVDVKVPTVEEVDETKADTGITKRKFFGRKPKS